MKSTISTSQTPVLILPRNEYGALHSSQVLSPAQQLQLKELLAKAVKCGSVPDEYITGDKKSYECMNHDIFDALIFRGKVKGCVVQARYFWKDLRKGYTRTQKTYFLVIRSGKHVDVIEIEDRTCVKRAKNTTALGQLIEHYLGKRVVACKPLGKVAINAGFKVLAKTDDGKLVSAFDGSEYIPGTWRIEAVEPQHGGGFYFYSDRSHAIESTKRGVTFASRVSEGKSLVLCAVEYKGKKIPYSGGKWAASGLRVVAELESLVMAPIES